MESIVTTRWSPLSSVCPHNRAPRTHGGLHWARNAPGEHFCAPGGHHWVVDDHPTGVTKVVFRTPVDALTKPGMLPSDVSAPRCVSHGLGDRHQVVIDTR